MGTDFFTVSLKVGLSPQILFKIVACNGGPSGNIYIFSNAAGLKLLLNDVHRNSLHCK